MSADLSVEKQADQRDPHRRMRLLRAGVVVTAMAFAMSSTTVTAYAAQDVQPAIVFGAVPVPEPQTFTVAAAYVGPTIERDAFTATSPEELAATNAAAAAAVAATAAAAAAALEAQNVAVAAASSTVPVSTRPEAVFAPPQAGYSGDAVVQYAQQFVGVVPYGRGANPSDSFMCDGLTQWVFGQHGIALPRTVTAQQQLGTRVSKADARAGDLVVWPNEHVGIYDGTGGVVHAPDWGHYVEHKKSLWGNPIFIRL